MTTTKAFNGWSPASPAPWRRWAARSLDLTINGAILAYAFGFIFFLLAPYQASLFFAALTGPGGVLLDMALTALMGTLATGLVIGLTGMSLGKMIFGVRVADLNGSPIGATNGIIRDFSVLFYGLGLAIPIVSLVTQAFAFQRLRETGSTSWDENRYIVTYRKSGPGQWVLNVLGVLLTIVCATVLRAISAS